MVNVIFDLVILSIIVVFIVDLSGAIDSLKSGLKWIITKGKFKGSDYRLKPFDCSLCSTFWVGLVYLLIANHFTLGYIAVVCLLAFFADVIRYGLIIVRDMLTVLLQMIETKLR